MFSSQASAGAVVPGSTIVPEWQGWAAASFDPQRLLERDRLAQIGRDLLSQEQTAGLPAGIVDAARAAVSAEQRAQQALAEAAATVSAWLARNRPADGRPHPQHAAEYAEAATAYREAGAAAHRALAELGRIAEHVAAARQVLASAPQRRQAAEQQYYAAIHQVEQDEDTARRELRALGLT